MDSTYRLDRLRVDGERLIEAAASDISATVPGCPGWSSADLLAHMGDVWRMLAHMVKLLPTQRVGSPAQVADRTGDAVAHYARSGLDELVPILDGADPTAEVWTFGEDKTVAFYIRRGHLETLVHRIDAEQAVDAATTVPVADAVDAIDELVSLISGRGELPRGSLHLHQTDGDGEWMLEVIDGKLNVRREHSKGDAALRAGAQDLMLVMWGRRSVDRLEFFGDRSIIEEWVELAP